MSKRRVPKKIKALLGINALLLVCIFICSFLLIKRITQPNEGNTSGSAMTRSLEEGSSSIEWTRVKKPVKLPILMYHYVYDPANPPADLNGNFIASTAFEQQLSYLKENDFYFPSYPEVKAFIEGKHSLPAKSVVLTFDDGEMGFLNVGVPLLEKHQVPATSFVIASDADAAQKVIDHRSPYVAFESHSFGMHKPGGNVGHGGIISAMSRDEIAADLKHAQEIVGGTQAFAYPFGDVTDDGRAAVRDAGILCAFTTQNSWAHVGDDVTALPRVRISGDYSLDSFIALVNG